MKKPPPLTEAQKRRLGLLEPQLRNAARTGNFTDAKILAAELQSILRPTGHHMRLFQSKNWLFEAALEAGEVVFARQGFEGIRSSVQPKTRLYLEATALLAVCYLRSGNIEEAKPFMAEVLVNTNVIQSDVQRRVFKRRLIDRFDEEAVLASLRDCGTEDLSPEDLEEEAGKIIQTRTEDEMFLMLGERTPEHSVDILLRINEFALKQLPKADLKFLPGPKERTERREVGKIVFASFKRILWRSLCDPESEIYQAWFNQGMSLVLNKKYIGGAVVATFSGLGIGLTALAVPAVALLIKFGLEVFCDVYHPEPLMEARTVRKNKN
ncbi:MAG: hypothetical protein M5R41_06825 [Bacteroidia bacterium]|nr:hypothetical protein [Bacteroidia bacterium]